MRQPTGRRGIRGLCHVAGRSWSARPSPACASSAVGRRPHSGGGKFRPDVRDERKGGQDNTHFLGSDRSLRDSRRRHRRRNCHFLCASRRSPSGFPSSTGHYLVCRRCSSAPRKSHASRKTGIIASKRCHEAACGGGPDFTRTIGTPGSQAFDNSSRRLPRHRSDAPRTIGKCCRTGRPMFPPGTQASLCGGGSHRTTD